MSIRIALEKINSSSKSIEDKSMLILFYLEYHAGLSLHGNGWIDDDEVALAYFEDDKGLLNELKEIMNGV
ncbi:MAG: hypothetical protein ABJH98_17680 [Reichenbachiella sp.]|uniref:hypothetical protein n=1 Tax=Reichenbachiella sp. TaxID=2184521 RepID=UPI0032969B0E